MSADFTIADVLAWARTKPADERYDYGDFRNCAVCQFLKDTSRCADPAVADDHWRDRKYNINHGRRISFDNAIRLAAVATGWTFGALADRLAALLPAEPLSDTWTKADAYLTDIEAVESVIA